MIDSNPKGDTSLLKIPMQNVGIVARSNILEGTASKRKTRIRRKIMIPMKILNNLLNRMVDIPFL
jgi:hypothetical protein